MEYTDMKEELDIFKQKSRELEMILDCIKDAICVVDRNGITKYWNKAAEELYQISRDKIIGSNIKEFFPNSLLARLLKEQKAYENIYNNPRENCYNVISASPLYLGNNLVGGVSLDRDITELIKTTELLKKAQSNLYELEQEVNRINKNKYSFVNIIGSNKNFLEAVNLVQNIAESNINVLITGESGTGKELFARAIHVESGRRGYFVPINCSAIPNELFESELFGYSGGAFTGALKDGKIGKIELAQNGTLLLDEIGDMPMNMQPKLLRVLEDGEMTRVGSEKSIKVNIRVIASTNKNLSEMVREGKFRKDLFYRLNSVMINLPPLRERKDDIPILINKFVEEYCMEYGVNLLNIAPEVMDIFMNFDWEGNIRELRNAIERIIVIAKTKKADVISASLLPDNIMNSNKGIQGPDIQVCCDLNEIVSRAEREAIMNAMMATHNNKAHAAKILNIPRSTLYLKLKRYNLE